MSVTEFMMCSARISDMHEVDRVRVDLFDEIALMHLQVFMLSCHC